MSDGTWRLTDSLTMTSVSDIYKAQHATWPTSGSWHIDLAQVNKIDSAGIALLLAAIRHCHAHQVTLTIVHWCEDAKLLIEAQGLNDIFKPYL